MSSALQRVHSLPAFGSVVEASFFEEIVSVCATGVRDVVKK